MYALVDKHTETHIYMNITTIVDGMHMQYTSKGAGGTDEVTFDLINEEVWPNASFHIRHPHGQ